MKLFYQNIKLNNLLKYFKSSLEKLNLIQKIFRFDIGSVISQKEILINPHDTYLDLYDKLARLGAKELVEIIHRLPDVLNNAKPQTENDVTNGKY